jgi:hypothetical protein
MADLIRLCFGKSPALAEQSAIHNVTHGPNCVQCQQLRDELLLLRQENEALKCDRGA